MSLNHDKIEQVYLWTMGSFSAAVWVKVCYVAICEMICLCVCIVLSKDLNLMAMGEETAQSLGIETARIRRIFDFSSIGDGCRMCFRQRCDWILSD